MDVGLPSRLTVLGGSAFPAACAYTWAVAWVDGPSGEAIFDGVVGGRGSRKPGEDNDGDHDTNLTAAAAAAAQTLNLPPVAVASSNPPWAEGAAVTAVNGSAGASYQLNVPTQGTRRVTVRERCPNSVTSPPSTPYATRTASLVVHFLPVRREIRSLMAADRELFLDSLRRLWALSTAEGRQRYGSAYLDVHDLNNVHRWVRPTPKQRSHLAG